MNEDIKLNQLADELESLVAPSTLAFERQRSSNSA